MANKHDLKIWIVEALKDHGGSAHIAPMCKYIGDKYESELRKSGDLFYTWQYDIRWAGKKLREKGVLQPKHPGDRGPWHFTE